MNPVLVISKRSLMDPLYIIYIYIIVGLNVELQICGDGCRTWLHKAISLTLPWMVVVRGIVPEIKASVPMVRILQQDTVQLPALCSSGRTQMDTVKI